MSRNRVSAKAAGTRFESAVATYMREHLHDDRIERRAKTGSKDRGDIGGVRHMGHRVVVEVKNVRRLALAEWVSEAQTEAGNDAAPLGIVVHKRHGVGITPATMGDHYVTMTLADLLTLMNGERPGGMP